MSDIKVLPVPRGSMVVLFGVELFMGEDEDDAGINHLIAELAAACGHQEFVVVNVPSGGGSIDVIGSVDELVEKVRGALVAAGIDA